MGNKKLKNQDDDPEKRHKLSGDVLKMELLYLFDKSQQ